MTFDSLAFLIFLPLVVGIHWRLPHRLRGCWLLAASYFFYMYWNPALIVLLLISTVIDYGCSRGMAGANASQRKVLLLVSILVNLGLLFSFKYLDFFGETVNLICEWLGLSYRVPDFNLILPVGISFYTFQTMSYTIDVYRGKLSAEEDFVTFALYVTFFPQLVAGPIERADRLLPQLRQERRFCREDLASGFQLLVSGFFRKVVIADLCGRIVDRVYGVEGPVDGIAVVVATVLFAVQIYCDFAGYSEIAAGSARLMGIRLMRNFDRPYLAGSIREFWHRWHISLSKWFADYVYIPLGGSRKGLKRQIFATLVVFAASGLWHGARWTFVLWGLFHGLLMSLELLLPKRKENHGWLSVGLTFCAVTASWIFFRSNTVEQAFSFFQSLISPWDPRAAWNALGMTLPDVLQIALVLLHLPGLHDLSRTLDGNSRRRIPDLRYVYYLTVILLAWLLRLENDTVSTFIYFQF